MSYSIIFIRLALIVGMMIVGFIAYKFKIVDASSQKTISAITFNISLPMLILSSVSTYFSRDTLASTGSVLLAAIVIYLISFGLSFLYVKLLRPNEESIGVHQYSFSFTNVAFVGIPIIKACFPEEAMLYGSVYVVLFSLVNHSIGAFLLSKKSELSFKTIFTTPSLIAALFGICLGLLKIQVPEPINAFISSFGNMTTPLAMMSIGITIAQLSLKEAFGDIKVYITCFIRLLVLPLLVMLVLRNLYSNYLMWAVPVIVAAMPAPSTIPILAHKYGADTNTAGKIMALSTMLATITIPFIAFLIL